MHCACMYEHGACLYVSCMCGNMHVNVFDAYHEALTAYNVQNTSRKVTVVTTFSSYSS